METKVCSKCGIEKNIEDFCYYKYKNEYKICSYCKRCKLEYEKIYKQKNKEKYLKFRKEYYQKNKEKYQKYGNKNLKKYKTNKDWQRNYVKNKKQNDKIYKLKCVSRTMICKSFKKKHYNKNTKSEKILGCNYSEFIKYLLETFKRNYGYEWDGIEKVHIDHIIPLATAKTEEEIINLCHYSNLQLLRAEDNLKKADKLDWNIDKIDN